MAANDQLIEDKVITLSSAFVEKSEPLKETQDGRLIRVRLRANVRVNKLLDSLRANKISTLKVDSESLLSQAVTKADQSEGTEELVKKLLPGLQRACLKVTAEGKPEIKAANGDEAELAFWLRVEPQREAYLAIAEKLATAFSATERLSGELVSAGTVLSDGGDFRRGLQHAKEYKLQDILQSFFFAEADRQIVENTVRRDGVSPVIKYEPMYAFADPRVSEINIGFNGTGIFNLSGRAWPSGAPDRELILLLLVNANESGARTRWKWFNLTAAEADLLISCLKATTQATAVIKGKSGEEITRDSLILWNVGISYMSDSRAIVIAPFFMSNNELDWYMPSLSVLRSVRLMKSELSSIQGIDAFVQEGDPLVIYGR
jgi:hypothetical protein